MVAWAEGSWWHGTINNPHTHETIEMARGMGQLLPIHNQLYLLLLQRIIETNMNIKLGQFVEAPG